MAITSNYEVNLEDEQFKKVDETVDKSWEEYNQTVGGMIGGADKYYQDLADQSQKWADEQVQLQKENTDFAIKKIEQQQAQAQKDYLKEQSGAYADWRKQSNQYGVEAEKMASAGLSNTGFSESSQVSMYNTYQNRVAVAREAFTVAKQNYENNIKEAILQNNAAMAEIYANAHKEQLELTLQGFLHNQELTLQLANKKVEFENTKWNRYQDVLQQINTQNALKAEIEKYNDNQKWQTEQNEIDRQHQLERDRINNEFAEKLEGIKHDYDIKYLNAKTEKDKETAKYEHDLAMKKLAQEQKDALERIEKDYAEKNKYEEKKVVITDNSGGGSDTSAQQQLINNAAAINQQRNAVNTAYYSGSLNSDAKKYGTFSNGYQPKGISGHGTLTKTGKTTNVKTTIQYGDNKGQKVTVKQNIWKAEDGTKWIWDGINNQYIPA